VQPPDGRIFRGAKRGKDCSGPSGRAAPGVVRSGPQVKIGWSEGHLLGVVVQGGASATLVSVDTEGGPCPASRCRTRATGWGVMGVYRDADRSCGIRYLSGLGGARRIVGGVVSCGRLTRPRSRFAAIASLFVLAAVLRRPRAARTSSFADSDRPASESGAAAPPLRADLPSNDRVGDGIGARSVAHGGSAAEVGQQHRSPPVVIMVGGVRRVRYSPVQRVRGPLLPNTRSEDPSRGLGPNSVTWGITGFEQSRPLRRRDSSCGRRRCERRRRCSPCRCRSGRRGLRGV